MVTLANLQGASLVPDITPDINLLLSEFGTGGRREQQAAEQKKQQDIQDALGFISSGDPDREEEGLVQIASIQGPAVANSIRETLNRGDQVQIAANAKISDEKLKDVLFLQDIKDPAKRANAITQLGSRPGADLNELMKLQNMTPEQQDLDLERDRLSLTALGNVFKERAAKQALAGELQKQAQAPVTLSPGQQRFGPGGVPGVSVPPAPPKPVQETTLVRNLKAAGVDLNTPQGQQQLLQAINKPSTKIDINQANQGLFKTPEGFMLNDRNDPTKGVKPIPGGPKDNVTGENAAKVQMLRTAKKAAKGVRELIFDKEGNLNDLNLIAAAVNAPGTDGRLLRTRMEFGIQAITRGETGAAMPPEEVENTRTRFMPSVFDSKEIAELKLEMFDDFLSGTLKLIDPTGRFFEERFLPEDGVDPGLRFDQEKFDQELERRAKKKKIPLVAAPTTDIPPPPGQEDSIFTGNKTPEGLNIFQRPDGSTFAFQP